MPWEKARPRRFDIETQRLARAHVLELARKHRITVHTAKHYWLAEAQVTTRQVWISRRLVDVTLYASALHELGHIASPEAHRLADRDDFTGSMMCEGAAWAWAFEHADPRILGRRPNIEFWGSVSYWLSTHLWDGYRQRLRKEPA